jgi:hypothetical protein
MPQLQLDTPVFDLIYPADATPEPNALITALGGPEAVKTRIVLDVDVDLPQYEQELNPTILVRKRGERRLLIIDETQKPMRKDPQREPIIAVDLRAQRDTLIAVVAATGARIGRLQAFGSFGDAAVVVRKPVDLRALSLLSWVLDPQTDVDGRRRATPLTQREFEEKIGIFPARLEELDEAVILSRVPPARLEKRPLEPGKGDLYIVDVLSDRDGSWDVRKSYELEGRVAATDLFSKLPGAKQKLSDLALNAEPRSERETPPSEPDEKLVAESKPTVPPPVEATPVVNGPPILASELGDRVVLKLPAERFSSDALSALSRGGLDLITSADKVSGAQKDRMHHQGCGFVAPLEFLSEVFVEGKPLDKKRLEADARPGPEGTRIMEVHLPRFGPALLIDGGAGKRWVSSELSADPAALLALARS